MKEEIVMEFLQGFEGTPMADIATAICFVCIPLAFVAVWCRESWNNRNECEGDKK